MKYAFFPARSGNEALRKVSFRAWCCALVGLCAAVSIFLPTVEVSAQRPGPTEYQVKAAYLYNFGKFVVWPGTAAPRNDQPFEICVLGADPFGTALDSAVTGETINGRGVAAKRIAKAREVDDCRILFISSSEGGRLPEIFAALERANVLTVSDIPEFSEHGGMIQFILDGNRVRFEVNLTNAEGAGLNLSSELLKVAARVTRTPHPGI